MMRRDAAMADVIGDVLLVGITVVLSGSVGVLLATHIEPPSPTSVDISVTSDVDTLRVHHAGGEEIDASAATLTLVVDDASHRIPLSDCPTTGGQDPSTFEPGERLTVADGTPECTGLPSGEITEMTLTVDPPRAEPRVVTSWTGSVQT